MQYRDEWVTYAAKDLVLIHRMHNFILRRRERQWRGRRKRAVPYVGDNETFA